jgi:hypothetical protein
MGLGGKGKEQGAFGQKAIFSFLGSLQNREGGERVAGRGCPPAAPCSSATSE